MAGAPTCSSTAFCSCCCHLEPHTHHLTLLLPPAAPLDSPYSASARTCSSNRSISRCCCLYLLLQLNHLTLLLLVSATPLLLPLIPLFDLHHFLTYFEVTDLIWVQLEQKRKETQHELAANLSSKARHFVLGRTDTHSEMLAENQRAISRLALSQHRFGAGSHGAFGQHRHHVPDPQYLHSSHFVQKDLNIWKQSTSSAGSRFA